MGIADGRPVRLVVAAEEREFRGILRNCGPLKQLGWPVAVSVAAEHQGNEFVFAANGPGPRLAEQVMKAAEVATGKAGFAAVISTGFCGGLDPQLQVGAIIEGTSVVDMSTGRQYECRPVSTSSRRFLGIVLSQDRVATTEDEKSALRQHAGGGNLAIEMEAAVVARWADDWLVPLYCLRVVSDTAACSMTLDMNLMRDKAGRFERGKIIAKALGRPWERIPGLLKLNRDCRVAEERLGEFFADCRFE